MCPREVMRREAPLKRKIRIHKTYTKTGGVVRAISRPLTSAVSRLPPSLAWTFPRVPAAPVPGRFLAFAPSPRVFPVARLICVYRVALLPGRTTAPRPGATGFAVARLPGCVPDCSPSGNSASLLTPHRWALPGVLPWRLRALPSRCRFDGVGSVFGAIEGCDRSWGNWDTSGTVSLGSEWGCGWGRVISESCAATTFQGFRGGLAVEREGW